MKKSIISKFMLGSFLAFSLVSESAQVNALPPKKDPKSSSSISESKSGDRVLALNQIRQWLKDDDIKKFDQLFNTKKALNIEHSKISKEKLNLRERVTSIKKNLASGSAKEDLFLYAQDVDLRPLQEIRDYIKSKKVSLSMDMDCDDFLLKTDRKNAIDILKFIFNEFKGTYKRFPIFINENSYNQEHLGQYQFMSNAIETFLKEVQDKTGKNYIKPYLMLMNYYGEEPESNFKIIPTPQLCNLLYIEGSYMKTCSFKKTIENTPVQYRMYYASSIEN